VDKARDIVGLYLDPPAKALVLCVDEKTHQHRAVEFRAFLNTINGRSPPTSTCI
jgi:hypothetical protein